jgi:hypothetical protein
MSFWRVCALAATAAKQMLFLKMAKEFLFTFFPCREEERGGWLVWREREREKKPANWIAIPFLSAPLSHTHTNIFCLCVERKEVSSSAAYLD